MPNIVGTIRPDTVAVLNETAALERGTTCAATNSTLAGRPGSSAPGEGAPVLAGRPSGSLAEAAREMALVREASCCTDVRQTPFRLLEKPGRRPDPSLEGHRSQRASFEALEGTSQVNWVHANLGGQGSQCPSTEGVLLEAAQYQVQPTRPPRVGARQTPDRLN